MNEQQPRKRGKDFLIGFLPCLALAIITVIFTLTMESLTPIIIVASGLLMAALAAFIGRRVFIGIGIITVLVATPLLLIGSCFALFAFK